MAIRHETLGQFPNHRRILIADTEAELLAEIPGTEIAEGYAKDTGINADWVQGVGWKVGGATRLADRSTSFDGPMQAPSIATNAIKSISGTTFNALISAAVPSAGTRIVPSDVAGCSLEVNGSGKWEGECGYVGDYAAFAALVAANISKFAVGTVARIANPLTSRGWIEMYLAADGLLRPIGGQMIYAAYGSVLDITAAGLSIGGWNEAWASPVLPAWIVNCQTLSLSVSGSVSDTVSTAAEGHRIRIATATKTDGDSWGSSVGLESGAAQAQGRGYSGLRVRADNRGNVLYGAGGGANFWSTNNPGTTAVGDVNATTTKIRNDVKPGATTNVIKLFAVELWAGG